MSSESSHSKAIPETLTQPAAPPTAPPPGESAKTEISSTGLAPTFPPPIVGKASQVASCPVQVGERIGDFEILQLLGAGSFAQVFLARQISLDRQVALKIAAHHGSEARTLANLEHDHIVRIFAESVDPERGLRLLCMQYVPGPTLEQVIRRLQEQPPESWNGRTFLQALDGPWRPPAVFDPAALRDREILGCCDFVECVCWIGSRLADALAHAHGQGVLHRDIKPANVLVNLYGRPLLADFNLALAPARLRGTEEEAFGGTLAYMSPEHLEAFDREEAAAQVDERSDIYALGVLLYELAAGRRPFRSRPRASALWDPIQALAAERRAGAPALPRRPDDSDALAHVIGRCLQPQPERRYQTAAELTRALEGCRELRRVAKELPPGGRLVRSTEQRPFLWFAILALVPHVLGSIVNISYNGLRIDLTPAQRDAFAGVTLCYNLLVYPLCLWLLYRLVIPVVRGWRGLTGSAAPEGPALAELRRLVRRLPWGAALLSALGWLPGGLVFPFVIDWRAGPIGAAVYGQFLISFTIAGLIALTYSVLGVQFLVLRVFYPRLWGDGQEFRRQARSELAGLGSRLWVLQLLAGLIPLTAAALLVDTGPEHLPGRNYQDFRLLVIGLIGLGTAGLVLAVSVSGFLSRTLAVLTGGERRELLS
jgi:serine/threonine protein kinase